jgi:hypothetical protein
MKILVKESQYRLFVEQFDPEDEKLYPRSKPSKSQQKSSDEYEYESGIKNEPTNVSIDGFYNPKDKHKYLTILQIATAFIPYAGPFISAGIGLYDAKTYYDEGDKTSAGLTAAFSMLPFVGSIVTKIPGVKQLGVKGMAILSSKLISKTALTKAELEVANSIVKWEPQVQKELMKMAPKLTKVAKDLNLYKASYIKKYGEDEYNRLLAKFLYDTIDEPKFIQTLKTASKSSNIKIKPILGGGADHRVFQSTIHPDRIIKAEVRPGEIDKWYNMFKSNPNVFAKTLGKTSVKNTDGSILKAVVMEKLDVIPFQKLWGNMEELLTKAQSKLPYNQQKNLEYIVKHINEPVYKNKWNSFIKYAKQQEPSISSKLDEFVKMVDELYKITPNPDIRKFNLGYDTNGVLKVLDI